MAKFILKHPIQFGSETIAELELRSPKARDFRKMPMAPTMGDIIDLIALLSGHPPSAIDEMHVEDLTEVANAVAGFIGTGPAIGQKA